MNVNTKLSYFASCPVQLEDLLLEEISEYEISNLKKVRGGVQFKTDFESSLQIMINSRIASRVYLLISSFKFRNINEAFKSLEQIWYEKYLELEQTFKVKTILDGTCKLEDKSDYINLKVKDSIVDFFQEKHNERPSVNRTQPDQSFLFHIEKREQFHYGSLYLDLCGVPLSNRFYRKAGHEAPMRENLAAAIIKLSDWNPKTEAFVDGMSGTGTFAIEAALIAADICPSFKRLGRKKSFSLLTQPWFKKSPELEALATKIINETIAGNEEKLKNLDIDIKAIEKSPKSIELLKSHLKEMKLDTVIDVEKNNFLKSRSIKPGVVVLNPPYGVRIKEEELEETYHQIGETFKNNYPKNRCYIFTANHEMRKKIRLKTNRRVPLKNGNLDARLLEYIIN